MIGYDEGPTLECLCVCQSTERTWQERTRGGGDKDSIVLHWFFNNEFEDAQEEALTQVPNHDKFVDAQNYIMAFFDIAANQRAPGQLQLDDCTHPSP